MLRFIRLLMISVIFICSFSTWVMAAEYKIDPTHSFVEFRIQHLGYSWLYGRFNDVKGDFLYDDNKVSESRFTVEISTGSVDTNHAERDKHIRSADFLDVGKFPQSTFTTKFFKGDKTGGILTGDLTLHGVTKEIKINVKKIGEGTDPWDGYRAGFFGTTKINRKDFGINYDLGPASDMMEFDLSIEGVRK